MTVFGCRSTGIAGMECGTGAAFGIWNGIFRFFAWLHRGEKTDTAADSRMDPFSSGHAPAVCAAAGSDREERNCRAEKLLDTYGNSILRLAYSYLHNLSDAEEVLQDTLVQFLRYAPIFENSGHEKAWLLRVAANLSKNRIEYNKIRSTDELDETLAAEKREDLSFVWEAVKELPQKYREVIHLFYYEGYSAAETAAVLGRNESTVRSDLRRGRIRLKEILKEAYDFEAII